jgi:hypothetical protein
LVALVILLAVVAYINFRPTASAGSDFAPAVSVQPLRVPNPSLHLEQLERVRSLVYSGSHRNIFDPQAPPPAASASQPDHKDKDAPGAPSHRAGPPPAPPLQVPLVFYGMAVDTKTGKRLGFFSSGEDVYITSEGDTLLGKFRLLRIGSDSVQFEEISTGRQAVLEMVAPETPPPSSPATESAPPEPPAPSDAPPIPKPGIPHEGLQ